MSRHEPAPTIEPDLETYRFDKQDWDGYSDLYDAFEWDVPEPFNLATYLCDRWAEATPTRPAMLSVDGDDATTYTFGELADWASRLAGVLADQGVTRGDRIAVSGAQRVEGLLTHLAAWRLGAVTVPLSLLFGPDGLQYRLTDSGADAFVATPTSLDALRTVREACPDLSTVLVVEAGELAGDELAFWDALADADDGPEGIETAADDPAIIMYTSGTTGPPKGVVHAHRSVLGALPMHVTSLRNMALSDDDVLYTPGEWSWIGPLYGFVLAGLYYGTTILGDTNPRFDPMRVWSLVDRFDVTSIAAPTTVYRALLQVPGVGDRYDLSNLRVVFEGGEALGQSVVEWFDEHLESVAVHEGYGQTEGGVFVGDCTALGVDHEPGCMGRPIPGNAVRIVEPGTADPVGADELGEIALAHDDTPAGFLGYWNRPDETAAAIVDGWLLTGDLGTMTADGYLSFHSRTDDVIISAGYRIGPAEIEESLAGHDAVADAGVIGVPDDDRGEVPKAFVVLADGHEPSAALREELKDHVKARLAKYEYPRAIEFIDELPTTTTGKVRRRDLREREGVLTDG